MKKLHLFAAARLIVHFGTNNFNTSHVSVQYTKEVESDILEQVEKLFEGAESFEEAIDAIYQAYPDFDTQKVEQMIEKLYANSFIYGQARIGEDHESEL